MTENEIALAVANNENHPWRVILNDGTNAIGSGSSIPAVGISGIPVIGVISGVVDASDSKRLTNDVTLDEMRALLANPNTWRKINPYQYVIDYPQIYHTSTAGVVVGLCVWDAVDAAADIDANEVPLFPNAEGAYVSGLGSKMTNMDQQFAGLAASFVPEYTAWLAAFAEGKTTP